MKQKLFVLGGNPHQIDDVRRRFGDAFDIVVCHSIVELQRNLEHHGQGAVPASGHRWPERRIARR